MGDIKLAVCIPTYNRPEVIEEFIQTCARQYLQHQFDIFIYDSSEDIQTEEVVKEYKKQFSNLYYTKVAPEIHSNMKVYNIFREFGHSLKYDYLWVCSDSIRWSQEVLNSVDTYTKKKYDIIIPNYRDTEKIGDKEYCDKNSLFLDCAWHMTLYGATILNVSTMLSDVNWESLTEKYAVPECINHSHVAFYFEKINCMNKWKAIHLSFPTSVLTASGLKEYSGWRSETFYVWCHCWPAMINKLPDCYQNKEKVIMKSGIYSETLLYSNLRNLRKDGIFNLKIYLRYKKEWRYVTSVSELSLVLLAVVPSTIVKYSVKGSLRVQIKKVILKKKIKKFCRKFDRIYIYGAGIKARRYTKYLNEMGIPFEGYLVSGPPNNIAGFDHHKVQTFCMDILYGCSAGILLALNEKNTVEVLKSVLKFVDKKKIFTDFSSKILFSAGGDC